MGYSSPSGKDHEADKPHPKAMTRNQIMSWMPLLIAAAVLIGFMLLKRASFVSAETARQLLRQGALVIDVRSPEEFGSGHLPNALNIPLGELRQRLLELPREREILVCCGVGQRAYYAVRLLVQHGFHASDLSGGMRTYNHLPEDFFSPRTASTTGGD